MKHLAICGVVVALIAAALPTRAQTPSDAITMLKGDICFLAGIEHGTWDQYWEGELLRTNGNVGTLSRATYKAGFAFGITDRINFLFELPYVKTESDGGQFAGVKGFQDFNFALKGIILEKEMGSGTFYALGTGAFATRASNYLSDYMPYSLGLGTNQYTLRGILQYKFNNGLYFRGSAAHIWRTETKAERDYYYNNGSYYTDIMDVPNAWNIQTVAGLWLLDDHLKIEAQYMNLLSTSGDDIRSWNAGQPTNKGQFHRVGGSVQYYLESVPGLGAIVYYNTTVAGRNTGKLSTIGGGITYQFSIY